MVIHDETVDRTTDGKGLVNQFSLPELKRFELKKNIPSTLTEVLNLIDQNATSISN
jgi:glycerophosphoryl diester phosphodiesterase